MVDGPLGSESSLCERLDALRAWKTAWASGEHPVHEVALLADSQRSTHSMSHYSPARMAVDIAYAEQQEGSLKIHRPPGPFCGLRARDYNYPGLNALLDIESVMGFHVDLAQDLFFWCNSVDSNNPFPTLRFCSLANGFGPHPDSARPTVTSSRFIGWFPVLRFQVLDDIVVWSMRGGDIGSPETDVLVINWKTGVIVWHTHLLNDRITAMLLTRKQLCLIHSDSMSIYLYTFDPCASADSATSVLKDSFAVLRLPPCHDGVIGKVIHGDRGLPPSYPDGTPHRFRYDHSHSLVTVIISLGYAMNIPGYDFDVASTVGMESFVLFIPVDTLLRQYRLADPHNQHATTPPSA
ncbi:hypothetical protein GY45DRAFT_1364247, partial [Cubamyces sp. BRFM 1775]